MAIGKNDINYLNNVQIKAQNNRVFLDDVRSVLFFTFTENIAPTVITGVDSLKGISSLTSESAFYQMIASAYSQKLTPVKVVIYGNKSVNKVSLLLNAYKDHADSVEVTNYATNDNLDSTKLTDLIETAKVDKKHIYHIGIKKSENAVSRETNPLETKIKQINLENVALYLEGEKNVTAKNWLVGAVLGGVIGVKPLGSYTLHSSEIVGFLKENYTETEQSKYKELGYNFISQPVKNYLYLVNGIATDNKMYIELKLSQLWLVDSIQKKLTVMQITQDKLPFKNDKGIDYARTVILSVCQEGADKGIFLTDNTGNYFGTYSQKDGNGKNSDIKLGYLNLGTLTQDNIREGILNFDLRLTADTGIRFIELNGTLTNDGMVVVN